MKKEVFGILQVLLVTQYFFNQWSKQQTLFLYFIIMMKLFYANGTVTGLKMFVFCQTKMVAVLHDHIKRCFPETTNKKQIWLKARGTKTAGQEHDGGWSSGPEQVSC